MEGLAPVPPEGVGFELVQEVVESGLLVAWKSGAQMQSSVEAVKA